MSQKQLAKALGYTTGQFISNFERGLCPLPVSTFKTLAKTLNLNIDYPIKLKINEYKERISRGID